MWAGWCQFIYADEALPPGFPHYLSLWRHRQLWVGLRLSKVVVVFEFVNEAMPPSNLCVPHWKVEFIWKNISVHYTSVILICTFFLLKLLCPQNSSHWSDQKQYYLLVYPLTGMTGGFLLFETEKLWLCQKLYLDWAQTFDHLTKKASLIFMWCYIGALLFWRRHI